VSQIAAIPACVAYQATVAGLTGVADPDDDASLVTASREPEVQLRVASRAARVRVEELAATQYGIVHVDQAVALGLPKDTIYRLVRSAGWTLALPRVIAVGGVTRGSKQDLFAACTWTGEGAAASYRSAGVLWELDGVRAGEVEITFPGRKQSPHPTIVVHEASSGFGVQHKDGIPVTTVTKTIVDLAGALSPDELELALEDALRRRLTSLPRLRMALLEHGGRRGSRSLRHLLEERALQTRPTDSRLEVKILRVLAKAGLPRPIGQYPVTMPGESDYHLDFAYPEARFGIEGDSYRWHSSRSAWRRDRARLNRLSQLGWRVLLVSWEDLKGDAAEFVSTVRGILGQRLLL
jgi:very-short-patch-repair endonuclease